MNATEAAMAASLSDRYLCEARAYCDRHIEEYTERDVLAIADQFRRRDFLDHIRPYTNIKMSVYNTTIPKIVVVPGELVRSEYEFTPEQQEILDKCDKYIGEIATQYGLPDQSTVRNSP